MLVADGKAKADAEAFIDEVLRWAAPAGGWEDGARLAKGVAAPRDEALLRYALKLTMRPGDMTAEDVEALRGAGLTDPEILDTVHAVAYYAYANRIADGLGIVVEPYRASP